MTAILTNILPATDTLPTRISVKFGEPGWGGKKLIVPWDYSLGGFANHIVAARTLWEKYGRPGAFINIGHAQVGHARFVHLFQLAPR